MKFNTLVFDANLPTVQQVNVPTNTDYKVGMKVKRNGEIQQLGPDEITIYTGEMAKEPDDTVGPTEISSLAKSITQSSITWMQSISIGSATSTELSAYQGRTLKAENLVCEYSTDNGATWHQITEMTRHQTADADVTHYPEIAADNAYSNLCIWKLIDGKWKDTRTGKVCDEITLGKFDGMEDVTTDEFWPAKFSFATGRAGSTSTPAQDTSVYFGGFTPSSENPVITRVSIIIDGKTYPVTIPTDADKTNGYITFTQAAGDEASFSQLSVVVDTTEFTAKFKLNVNIFQSQQGDINVDAGGPGTDIDVNSVKTKTLEVVDSTGELAAALSCDASGHGLLVLDNIAFTGADLSATFAANQILEGLV